MSASGDKSHESAGDPHEEEDMTEEKFAQYVEEAKKELKKQVLSMLVFSTVFTLVVYGVFYWIIDN